MYRRVEPGTESSLSPGMVDAVALRKKLSKQLKIDLDHWEKLHIREDPLEGDELSNQELLQQIVDDMDTKTKCTVEIRKLGDYVACISLAGRYSVPLKFTIIRTN